MLCKCEHEEFLNCCLEHVHAITHVFMRQQLRPSLRAVSRWLTERPRSPVSWGGNTPLTAPGGAAGRCCRQGSQMHCSHVHTQTGLRVWSGIISPSARRFAAAPWLAWPNFHQAEVLRAQQTRQVKYSRRRACKRAESLSAHFAWNTFKAYHWKMPPLKTWTA